MAEVKAFGRPIMPGLASAVQNNPSLNANPAPSNPAQMPADGMLKFYELGLYATQELSRLETDPFKLGEIQQCREFFNRVYSELQGIDRQVGTPEPATPPPAPMPMAAPPQSPAVPGPPAPPMGGPPMAGPPIPGAMP